MRQFKTNVPKAARKVLESVKGVVSVKLRKRFGGTETANAEARMINSTALAETILNLTQTAQLPVSSRPTTEPPARPGAGLVEPDMQRKFC